MFISVLLLFSQDIVAQENDTVDVKEFIDSNNVNLVVLDSIVLDTVTNDSIIKDSSLLDSIDSSPLAGKFDPVFTGLHQSNYLIDDIYAQNYDFPGARAHFISSSIANPVGITHPYAASGLIQQRNLYGIGGYWSGKTRSYDYATINLHGENGMVYLEANPSILDTPVVSLQWERGAFRTNMFKLSFERLLTDSIMVRLYAETNSIESDGEWRYANNTHQPFLSFFKRDSSRIPFSGRNAYINTSHFIPAFSVYRKNYNVHVFSSFYTNKSSDFNQYLPIVSDVDYSLTYKDKPYNPQVSDKSFGFKSNFFVKSKYQLNIDYKQSNIDTEIDDAIAYLSISDSLKDYLSTPRDSLFPPDSIIADSIIDSIWTHNDSVLKSYDDIKNYNNIQKIYSGNIKLKPTENTWWPSINLSYEYLRSPEYLNARGFVADQGDLYQDKQLAWLESKLDLDNNLSYRLQAGASRHFSAVNETNIDPALSAQIKYQHKYFDLSASATDQHKYPDYDQLKYFKSGRLYFANKDLSKERVTKLKGQTQLYFGKYLSVGYKQKYELLDNPMVPAWLSSPRDTISDTLAYSETNGDFGQSLSYSAFIQLNLGNWKFSLERADAMQQELIVDNRRYSFFPHQSRTFYKGQIYWSNVIVDNKLGVEIQFNWNWFGSRYTYARDDSNSLNSKHAYQVKLPHYLALDFQALMKIKTFQLYGRIDNMNHSIYAPDVGYTPTGMTFRYGITWNLFN